MAPNEAHPFDRRSFFTSNERKDLGYGVELWRGIFQSVRPAIERLIVTVDLSTGVVFKAGPLIRLCLDLIAIPGLSPNQLYPTTMGFQERDRVRLQSKLKYLKVTCRTTGPQPRTIRSISKEGANTLRINPEDENSDTIVQYFQSLNMAVRYPNCICVKECFHKQTSYFGVSY